MLVEALFSAIFLAFLGDSIRNVNRSTDVISLLEEVVLGTEQYDVKIPFSALLYLLFSGGYSAGHLTDCHDLHLFPDRGNNPRRERGWKIQRVMRKEGCGTCHDLQIFLQRKPSPSKTLMEDSGGEGERVGGHTHHSQRASIPKKWV